MTAAAAPLTETSPPARSSFYIPSLDGMRAVAFLIVFLAHAQLWAKFPGNFGVTMFFFLSGFLITTLMRMEFEATGKVSLKQFYLRRVLRIFPPFYLILLTTALLVVTGVFVGDVGLVPVLAQALHLSNYQIITHGYEGYLLGTYAYWSLAVEEHFYLIFPLSYLMMRRYLPSARRQALALAVVCGIVLLWRFALVFELHASKDRTYIATDTRVDSILFGCILAIWGNPVLDRFRLPERLLKYVLLPLCVAVLLATFVIPSNAFRETIRYTLQGLALFPIFIAAMQFPAWGPFRILNLSVVRMLGLISYSTYLLHEIVIYNVYPRIHANTTIQAMVALAITIAICTVIYRCIERPAARLRKRLSYRAAGARRGGTRRDPRPVRRRESAMPAPAGSPER